MLRSCRSARKWWSDVNTLRLFRLPRRTEPLSVRKGGRPAIACYPARMPSPSEVTQLLVDWQNGSPEALEKLMPLVYSELRAIAQRYLSRERVNHTLQSTSLVHEAYFKLIGQRRVQWQNRAHFL